MAWIKKIEPGEASGHVRREYDMAQKRAGYIAQILQVMSLDGSILRNSMNIYKAIMFGPGTVTRSEREAMATLVSAVNHCHY
ncbi:MAG: peroxidase [Planctomycetota bacterium]|nr:peroxidase [Planctomycetota bacterium]